MATNEKIRLAVFGLSEYEKRVLRTISILSRNSSRTYEITHVSENAEASDAADFAVVDAEDQRALAGWHALQASKPMVPAVMVGRAPASESTEFGIGRPIMATRLLAVLNRMNVSKERPVFASNMASNTAPTEPPRLHPVGHQPPASTGAVGRRALVVDDSLPIRRQVQLEAKRFVGEVDLAEDGEQAIELLTANSYDIVFLDVVLPGIDGYQICRRIKRDKRTKDTPVIMLTGKSSPFDRVKGKLAGCDTYLTKPVNQAKFDKVVNKLLS